jgi:hypothetical protein
MCRSAKDTVYRIHHWDVYRFFPILDSFTMEMLTNCLKASIPGSNPAHSGREIFYSRRRTIRHVVAKLATLVKLRGVK